MDFLTMVSCGGFTVDKTLPNLVTMLVRAIQIAIPLILIIYGMLDFGKAVMAQKEDEIKKGQQTFIKRAIAALLVFLVVAIVTTVFGLLANASGDNSPMACVNCFLNSAKCTVAQ